MQDIDDFLIENKIQFETLIRCFNYWSALNQSERNVILDLYQEGELSKYGGWY